MAERHKRTDSKALGLKRLNLDHKLTAYFAAVASGSLIANEAEAVIVSNNAVQPFDINGAVPIDFNSDGQIDFEIDHDRVDLGGGNIVDYLQLDKNDINGASPGEDLFAVNFEDTFSVNGAAPNENAQFAYVTTTPGTLGEYPAALTVGTEIGPVSPFDFQEGDNFNDMGQWVRANRLIDEDRGQVDMQLGGVAPENVYLPTNGPNFLGLNNEVRYLGVKMDLNNADVINYGWIGVRILSEEDATGEVVGWGYETEHETPIIAGALAPGVAGDYNGNGTVDAADYVVWRKNNGLMGGATPAQGDGTGDGNVTVDDYNFWRTNFGSGAGGGALAGNSLSLQAVPEPSSLLLTILGAIALVSTFFVRRFRRLK